MKRTLKNVKRLEWLCFAMCALFSAWLYRIAQLGAEGYFAENIALYIVLMIALVLGCIFWFLGFVSYMEIEQEIIDKAEG